MPPALSDDAARRLYWIEQMDAAYAFMDVALAYPVSDCLEPAVPLQEALAAANVEVAFSDAPHGSGLPRIFRLREGLIPDVIAIAREMNKRGWTLKIEDAFRSRPMQRGLSQTPSNFDRILDKVLWERNGTPPSPEFMLKRVTALIATCPKIGTHMSASAMDISVLDRDTGEDIDRGAPYLEMSELTPMPTPFISDDAKARRDAITRIFEDCGFVAYPFEFWHYSKGDAYDQHLNKTGQPAIYGAVDVDMETGEATPIEDPETLLNALDVYERQIVEALERRQGRG